MMKNFKILGLGCLSIGAWMAASVSAQQSARQLSGNVTQRAGQTAVNAANTARQATAAAANAVDNVRGAGNAVRQIAQPGRFYPNQNNWNRTNRTYNQRFPRGVAQTGWNQPIVNNRAYRGQPYRGANINTGQQWNNWSNGSTHGAVYTLRWDESGREFICVNGQRVYFDSPAASETANYQENYQDGQAADNTGRNANDPNGDNAEVANDDAGRRTVYRPEVQQPAGQDENYDPAAANDTPANPTANRSDDTNIESRRNQAGAVREEAGDTFSNETTDVSPEQQPFSGNDLDVDLNDDTDSLTDEALDTTPETQPSTSDSLDN